MALVLLICFVLFLVQTGPSSDLMNASGRKFSPDFASRRLVVIFDAVSSRTKVPVFSFDHKLDLVPIGNDLELYAQAGFVDPSLAVAKVRPADFEQAAKHACQTSLEDGKSTYPSSHPIDTLGRKFSPDFMSKRYVVIFDAGSSGSRVHVFSFNHKLDLVPIGNDLELFEQIKPGLSKYACDPEAAANSLLELLKKAEAVVPQEIQHKTPVRVGATARLRQLEGDTSDRILQSVRDFLKNKSSLKSNADWVTILDGTQEGAYKWVAINYLLEKLGKPYPETVGVIDLGGGSVQMAYAISESDAEKAPKTLNGEGSYVQDLYLMGRKYHRYVHSYLNYGLLAARAEILKAEKESGSPCILAGYKGNRYYKYGPATYSASASTSGSSLTKCREVVLRALKVDESCTYLKCTFGGMWNGGGGLGQKNLFLSSFFFDRAAQAGFVDPSLAVAKVHPADFEEAAKRACESSLEDGKSTYPRVDADDLPFLCMDLVYQFTLLIDGFGLDPWQEITLVKKVEYRNSLVEPVWSLGSAVEVVSSSVL